MPSVLTVVGLVVLHADKASDKTPKEITLKNCFFIKISTQKVVKTYHKIYGKLNDKINKIKTKLP